MRHLARPTVEPHCARRPWAGFNTGQAWQRKYRGPSTRSAGSTMPSAARQRRHGQPTISALPRHQPSTRAHRRRRNRLHRSFTVTTGSLMFWLALTAALAAGTLEVHFPCAAGVLPQRSSKGLNGEAFTHAHTRSKGSRRLKPDVVRPSDRVHGAPRYTCLTHFISDEVRLRRSASEALSIRVTLSVDKETPV